MKENLPRVDVYIFNHSMNEWMNECHVGSWDLPVDLPAAIAQSIMDETFAFASTSVLQTLNVAVASNPTV